MSVTNAKVDLVEYGKDMQVHRAILDPGGKISNHAHDVASTYVVLNGRGRLTGPSDRDVKAGDVVLIDAGQVHGWANEGSDPLSFVAVFSVGVLETNFQAA